MHGISFWKTDSGGTPPPPPTHPIEHLDGYMPYGYMTRREKNLYVVSRERHCVMQYSGPSNILLDPWENIRDKKATIRYGTLDTAGNPPYNLNNPTKISVGINGGIAVVDNNFSRVVYYPSGSGSYKSEGRVVAVPTCGYIHDISLIDHAPSTGQMPGLYALVTNPLVSPANNSQYYFAVVRYDLDGADPTNYELIGVLTEMAFKESAVVPCSGLDPDFTIIESSMEVLDTSLSILICLVMGHAIIGTHAGVFEISPLTGDVSQLDYIDTPEWSFRQLQCSVTNSFGKGSNMWLATTNAYVGEQTRIRGNGGGNPFDTTILNSTNSYFSAVDRYGTNDYLFLQGTNRNLYAHFEWDDVGTTEIATSLAGNPFV